MPDLQRFERLILPHLDDAYTLARYLVRDEHDAQDVVQDAYLRALRHFDGFRDGNARAWLLAIVRNGCNDWLKGRSVERLSVPFAFDIADARSADERAIRSSERERLTAALGALSNDLCEVIVLREVNDLSYKEIADVVGVPIGTVMSRLARARQLHASLLCSGGITEGEAS